MNSSAPAIKPKSLRFAVTLNLLLPGAGQLYTVQTALGLVYTFTFLAAFVTVLTVFLRAYAKYLAASTSGDILESDNLEQLAHAFPNKLLVGLLILSLGIFFAALLSLRLPRKSRATIRETLI